MKNALISKLSMIAVLGGGLVFLVWTMVFNRIGGSVVDRVADALYLCGQFSTRTSFVVCIKDELRPLYTLNSPEAVHMAVVEAYKQQPELGDDLVSLGQYGCHDVQHALGQLAFEYYRETEAAFESCLPICAFGCYHGVTELAIAEAGGLSSASGVCGSLETDQRRPCYHGVGHGVQSISRDVSESLKHCDAFESTDAAGLELCAYGVFMEAFTPSVAGHEPLPIPADFSAFCASLDSEYTSMCLSVLGAHVYLQTGKLDLAVVACRDLAEQEAALCWQALGQELTAGSGFELDVLLGVVSELTDGEALQFVSGVAEASVWADPYGRSGKRFCLKLQPELKDHCLSQRDHFIERFGLDYQSN